MKCHRIGFRLLGLVCLGVLPAIAVAQNAAGDAAAVQREALQWLDGFARYQVLFHKDDVQKLRDRVAAMTPADAAKWWQDTAPQREVLNSPEWAETSKWLGQFLQVQAIYSDEQIRYLQTEALAKAKESPESLKEVMDRIAQQRRKLAGGAQVDAEVRKLKVAALQAYKQDEVREREAALRLRASQPAAAPAPTTPIRKRTSARSIDPLVDSLDMARWAVIRQLYPRW